MQSLTEFADASNPIRCSAIPKFMKCPWSVVMMHLSTLSDTSGPAADTGSAVHKAAYAWHQMGMTVQDAIKEMERSLPDFPLADLSDAEAQFLAYAIDPRNRTAQIVVCESEVAFEIEASPDDPTGRPIHFKGTLDQVRREADGSLKLYDIKTSKWPGMTIMLQHWFQIAAYCVGATEKLKQDVHPGAIIMTRPYLAKSRDPSQAPDGVFFRYAKTLEDARWLLRSVADVVAMVRRGNVWINPGEYCSWCSARSPDFCMDDLRRIALQ